MITRLLAHTWPWRWWCTARWLARGVRVHPSALLRGRLQIDRGAKLGARVRIAAGASGTVSIAGDVWVSSDVEMETDTALRLGRGTTVQRRCTLNGSTRIGEGCIFAPNVFVSSGTHPFRAIAHLPIREQERRLDAAGTLAATDRPVWIQDDCWLGVNAVVCPGVTIGKGSVIGANAVVTQDVAPNSVMAGSPAREIGRRLDWRPPAVLQADRPEDLPYLLCGRVRPGTDDRAACIEVSAEAPLLAVLAADGAIEVALYFEATRPVTLVAAAQHWPLPAGAGRIEIPLAALRVVDTTLHCALTLRESGTVLRVHRLEVVGATQGASAR